MSRRAISRLYGVIKTTRRHVGELKGAIFIWMVNRRRYPRLGATPASLRRFVAIMDIKEGHAPEWRGPIRQEADDLWLFLVWEPLPFPYPRTQKLDLSSGSQF